MNDHRRERTRSRSPNSHDRSRRHRSPGLERKHGSHHHASRSLPHNARELTKYDLPSYRPMFALYLDIQKQRDIEELSEDEVKGRWKSFMNKWNRGELAEGWYDPATLTKAIKAQQNATPNGSSPPQPPSEIVTQKREHGREDIQARREVSEDEEDFGPSLPQTSAQTLAKLTSSAIPSGPTIPSLQDLQYRDENIHVATRAAQDDHYKLLGQERKGDRKLQQERLEDLVPRADPGSRERQLEKKRDIAVSNRVFAASKDSDTAEVQDSDLMGEDTMSELKNMKKEQERRKTEREIKREEILRARMVEREERVKHMRAKEDKTMSMLREIAKERFGDGNVQPATLREE